MPIDDEKVQVVVRPGLKEPGSSQPDGLSSAIPYLRSCFNSNGLPRSSARGKLLHSYR